MTQSFGLYRLQQTDNQIDRIHSRLQSIQDILDDSTDLRNANMLAEKSRTDLHHAESNLRIAEAETQDQRIKSEQINSSLYDGKVRSSKELIDLQNDLASLKRQLTKLEDNQLSAMLALEESQSANKTAQEELRCLQDRSLAQQKTLNDEKDQLQLELERLFSERSAISGSIPTDAIHVYDRLRQQKRGIAVTTINDNSCSSCGAGLTAAQIQSIRVTGRLSFCPSCGRILYAS
jgi:uncharacterized protein